MTMFVADKQFHSCIEAELLRQGVKPHLAGHLTDMITYCCSENEDQEILNGIVVAIEPSHSPQSPGEWGRPDLQAVSVYDGTQLITSFVATPHYQPIAPHLLPAGSN